MAAHRFDRLARALAVRSSRRQVVKGLACALALGLTARLERRADAFSAWLLDPSLVPLIGDVGAVAFLNVVASSSGWIPSVRIWLPIAVDTVALTVIGEVPVTNGAGVSAGYGSALLGLTQQVANAYRLHNGVSGLSGAAAASARQRVTVDIAAALSSLAAVRRACQTDASVCAVPCVRRDQFQPIQDTSAFATCP